MKRVLVISPNASRGQPVSERTNAYVDFLLQNDVSCETYDAPTGTIELIRLIRHIYKHRYQNILVTMPPFRNWIVCFLPRVNTTLDIRDGWSIAIASGYGGAHKPRNLKAIVAKLIERLAIRNSKLTITCTPGLVKHLNQVAGRETVKLITNGFSQSDYDLVQQIRSSNSLRISSDRFVFVCAGKFSEYGVDNAMRLIDKLNIKYSAGNRVLKLIGADREQNAWLFDYLNRFSNFHLEILPRLDREALFAELRTSNIAIALIRDPGYEFGTKIFDYILCNVSVFDYFDDENEFKKYFHAYLDSATAGETTDLSVHLRHRSIEKLQAELLEAMK